MLIKRLEVKGFKSLRDVVWEPGPLTVLIGPNGSGKSNLLQSLALLKNISTGELGKYIQTNGGVSRVSWDGDSNVICISVNSIHEIYSDPSHIEYKTRLLLNLPRNSYTISKEYFIEHSNNEDNNERKNNILIHREPGTYKIYESNGLTDVSNQSLKIDESFYSVAVNPYHYDNTLCYSRKDYSTIALYQIIEVNNSTLLRKPLVSKYSTEVNSDGQNLVNVLHTLYSENRDFENDINTAMRAAFGDDFDRLVFPPAADQLVQLRIRWKSLKREQSMADLSDGTIRFLFLMTVLCNPDPAPLIAIDEPETGLHPSMFPIIAEYAAEASKRTQVIFSTHSPQFLDAFSDFNVTTTVTAWKDGETKIKNLDGDTLKKWLEHYSLGTLFLSGDLEALA